MRKLLFSVFVLLMLGVAIGCDSGGASAIRWSRNCVSTLSGPIARISTTPSRF